MKIYFAGAIRGGRQDASTYHAMIAHLQTHGEVLTEHVGNKALSDGGEHDLTDDQIHARDMAWLEECDAVVAEDICDLHSGTGHDRRGFTSAVCSSPVASGGPAQELKQPPALEP